MKNIIIGLIIGLLLNGLVVYAKEKIIMNPDSYVAYVGGPINTTKVTTPEGTYRLFTYQTWHGGGITAVKIK